jgi:hypothetical protein
MARPEVTGRSPEVTDEKPKKKRRFLGPPTCAFTIQEFCDAHRISRSRYFELKKLGLGPAEKRVLNNKIIITQEAAAAWRRKDINRANAA